MVVVLEVIAVVKLVEVVVVYLGMVMKVAKELIAVDDEGSNQHIDTLSH